MIELPIIYRINQDGEKWVEYVCETSEEAHEKLKYLKKRRIKIPEIEDEIWDLLGLGFLEREFIIQTLKDFKSYEETDTVFYSLEYDYINDGNQHHTVDLEGLTKFRVIKVSNRNRNGNYIHWLVKVDEPGVSESQIVYKVSLSEPVPVGKEDHINLNEFKIVKRPSGFSYKGKNGKNRILHSECWLFIKKPGE